MLVFYLMKWVFKHCVWDSTLCVEASWNAMAHAHKADFDFRRNGRAIKSAGASVHSTTGGRGVRISVSNAGYTMFHGSVKRTGYPLRSLVSPSLPLPFVTVWNHLSTGLYEWRCVECGELIKTEVIISRRKRRLFSCLLCEYDFCLLNWIRVHFTLNIP
jgi:hypothetical protein